MVDRTLLPPDQVAALGERLPGWDCDGTSLSRVVEFTDFAEAFAFMVRVAEVAEDLDHHPDWSNSWNRVTLAVSHSAGGLTSLDVEFAQRVDQLVDS
jgi:4a-hydroxytetrahydrobiopterin dehydratase